MARPRVLRRLQELGVPGWEGLRLEHALHVNSEGGGPVRYRRFVNQWTYALEREGPEREALLALVERRGAVAAVAARDAWLHRDEDALRNGEDDLARRCDERLRAYCDMSELVLPDAGLQCARCRSRRLSLQPIQLRSADEPMSILASCEDCGKNWKM